ncbi:hypothetical protein Nepgr_006855 [Nepenthes gracilis]|uniref:Uncharacterized protein n=1 Tax=Nepenthes gracilis TaxID=150966 RepID=A0AAD3S663_NEPGR|nr:hypothetical protein Nepgr_006855 [Nepenthes gracilis]
MRESITRAYAGGEEANEAKRPERADRPRPFLGEGKRKYGGGEHSHRSGVGLGLERKDHGPTTFTPLTDTRSNVLMRSVEKSFEVAKDIKKDCGNQSILGHLTRFVKGPGQNSGAADEEGQEQTPPRNRIAAGVVNMVTT